MASNAQKIAIVGVAFRFPGDLNSEAAFWQALTAGEDLVGEIDPDRWATEVLKHPKRSEPGRSVTFSAGVLSRIDEFDAGFFGISPREAAWMDPQQRLMLELSWEAMENGGLPASRLAGSDCAVYVGVSGFDYGIRAIDDMASFAAHTMTGNTLSIVANRLSYVFDLHGPSMAIDTACSSSLVALHQACNSLKAGDASMALVGGVNLLAHPYPFIGFSKASMLSERGRCRTFDASGDGYVRSEGGAVLLLKPLEQAEADGDHIHAVILASGANADGGRKTGLTIPSAEGQIELMRSVLARAGIDAASVDYLEAHGTGTTIGDPIETSAIGAVYGKARPSERPLPIGSVKANLGHLEPASGMAGLVKALLVLKHRRVPPSIHLENPNPRIDFAGWHLQPAIDTLPLDTPDRRPCVVGVNSFGFGGANAHVLLQEYAPSTVEASWVAPVLLPPLLLSAKSDQALRDLAGRYAVMLEASSPQMYYDVAYAACMGRECLEKRLIVRQDSVASVVAALLAFAEKGEGAALVQGDFAIPAGEMAFIYSGNGAQWIGMGQLLLSESPRFAEILEDLDAAMVPLAGFSLIAELRATGAASRMADTAVAQPLLFAIQVGLTLMLNDHGLQPYAVAGHSVGEVAAAWAAGELTLAEALRVICARSAAQALTRGAGRMAVIALSEAEMRDWLTDERWPDLEIAGINSPANLTLSGPLSQLEALGVQARANGVVFRLLDLDYAFHSRSMDSIESTLLESLEGFAPLPGERQAVFVSTVTGDCAVAPLGAGYWWDNVRRPVLFKQALDRLCDLGCRTYIEISPHAILQRYLVDTLAARGVHAHVFPSLRKNHDGEDVLQALALRLQLATAPDSLQAEFPVVGRFVELPAYPWQRERHWLPATVEGYRLIERKCVHPLLGWPLQETSATWENVLDPRTQCWLKDHVVGGAVVLPGAAYLEMALAAARESVGGDSVEIEELDIVAPIVFDGEHARSVRFELNPRDGGFTIRSRQRLVDDEWVINASGRLLGVVQGYEIRHLPDPGANAAEISGELHYALARLLGLDYGEDFRRLQNAVFDPHCLRGYLQHREMAGEGENWNLYPAILDVCFQSLLDFFRAEIEAGSGSPLLPVKIGRLRLLHNKPVVAFRTCIRRLSLRSVLADFELLAVDGATVAILTDCRFRAASLRQHKAEPARWEIVPIVQPGPQESRTTTLPEIHTLIQGVRDYLQDHESRLHRAAYFDEVQPLFDALVTAFSYEALQTAMCADPEGVAVRLDVVDDDAPQHPFVWLKEVLSEQALLILRDGKWQLAENDMPSSAEIWRTLLADHPECMPELLLVGRKGKHLADLLLGRIDVACIAADLAASHQMEAAYDDSLSYLGVRHGIENILRQIASVMQDGRRLRILEISPGISELPRHLQEALPAERTDYVIAHTDAALCDQLAHEYQDVPWVSTVMLDASIPALKTKHPLPELFDVVILRHYLNSVADPHALLAWTRSQMATGGILVMTERYGDLAGYFLGDGRNLVGPASWEKALLSLSFEQIETCREPAGEATAVGAYLLLAKSGEQSVPKQVREPARWLLLVVDGNALSVAEQLRETMVGQGQIASCVMLDDSATDQEAMLLSLLGQQSAGTEERIDHVLLIAPDVPEDDFRLPLLGAALVRLIAGWQPSPTLCLVTRGAVPVDGLVSANERNPAHTALWGLGRVVMNEYPGLNCRLVDLPRFASMAQTVELLGSEILDADNENEVLLLNGARRVLRLRRHERNVAKLAEVPRFRLDFRVPGQLRNLLWLEPPKRELAPDEVEVRPMATGLNFRDVMYVMGLLPDEAVERGFAGASLGLEFAGIVTKVGDRVDDFVPGDPVMGFGAACFASHVVTRANALMVKPEGWSFEAAATVPTVFFTVYYALKQLADLQPGERVLVHGGAGGVGIAAIQLARHLGAEVFATAGSAEKRQFIELLGADHVFDSRSLAYADQILSVTAGEGVDVVLNSLAGEAIRRNFRVLRPFGRFLELGKRDFFENTPIGLRPFKDNISYFGIDADQLLVERPDLANRLFREVMALFRSGVLSPLPARVFPAAQVVEAFRYMQQARQIGKVVVSFEGSAPRMQLPSAQPEALRFSREACYVVTGGLSGFGLETARWLAEHGAGQLLLLSRRGMDTESAVEALASLAGLGADVQVVACDVADFDALALALECAGRKPLKGVFHAAMVLDDALISNLDSVRMRRVMQPKIVGAWNLHVLTRRASLDHFVLYSSVTTYIGNPGQANYVAANAWLEGLASSRRAEGLPATCIGWGPIGDAGYLTRNQSVKDGLSHRLGADPLAVRTALQELGKVLLTPTGNVSIGDFQFQSLAKLLPSATGPRFEFLRRQGEVAGGVTESLEDFRAMIEGKSSEEIKALVEALVAEEVAQILGIGAERIDPVRSLHDLGLDSLMGVELALGLQKRFGIQISAMMLNEGPTVERVGARIIERLASGDVESADGLAESVKGLIEQHGGTDDQDFAQSLLHELKTKT